ncbi:MAG: tRNA lysidine(34) synthetase TilS, partial [Clostridia bacterium]|nr:tRNA lysidine(34) synthetase TilS [Clostridia bacterium]
MFDLSVYAKKHVCVAVSGGRDSMALIFFLYTHMQEYGITLSALNCDHKIRGEASARDSALVERWCKERNIPLMKFVWNFDGVKTEQNARIWRRECYKAAIERGADFVATAHHMNDNAETVLFNLARGSAVAGIAGIVDGEKIIHPMISCTRMQIDAYVAENNIPYADDETNFTDGYTRNKIRLNVLPELEKAVPNAIGNIYRLSRLALEDEKYFKKIIEEREILLITEFGVEIKLCESVIFKRAAVQAIKYFNCKDYTSEHLEKLYLLALAEKNKKFEFLGLTAYGAEGKIVITNGVNQGGEIAFSSYKGDNFCGRKLIISRTAKNGETTLKFDMSLLPENAVIRFKRDGDKFK